MLACIEPFSIQEVRVSGCAGAVEIEPGQYLYTFFQTQLDPMTGKVERIVCAKHVYSMNALKQTAFLTRSWLGLLSANDVIGGR